MSNMLRKSLFLAGILACGMLSAEEIPDSGYCWRKLPLAGERQELVRKKYGQPKFVKVSLFTKPAGCPIPEDADEQWVYVYPNEISSILIFFKEGTVLVAIEEWSDW